METQKIMETMTNEALLEQYMQTRDSAVKRVLVMRYVYIVRNIAIQMRGVYVSFAQIDDIINEGVLAIMTALDKYDPDKNVKFETYISKRIRGLIIDIARRNDWVPRSVRKSAKDIDEAVNVLYTRLGRFPTDQEIAKHMNISVEKYQEDLSKRDLYNLLSLDMLLEDAANTNTSSQFKSEDIDYMPEKHLENSEMEHMLKDALETLRENEQLVMSLYYRKELNMKEIASVMRVSEPRVSQIHANALRKLRLHMQKFADNGATL